ncbi:tyrosine-type recombinase/integrase [Dechloromonas sp. ARDL1]|uniref:tyrosine-type recombinase/integrase n=1 Tax=Dechloromonas sp. ARDL1 TaxID=3322121 RepID=UPI003DA7998F
MNHPLERRAAVLDEALIKRLIAVARNGKNGLRNEAMIYLSFGLGLRAKEMAALKVRDVMLPNGDLRDELLLGRKATKGGKVRLVYLTQPAVRKSLARYLAERKEVEGILFNPDSALLKSQKGGAFSPNTLQQLFARLYEAAGINGASSHSGRRTFATGLIERGVDIKAVSTLMGHASVAMTARYVENNPVRLKRICGEVAIGLSPTH